MTRPLLLNIFFRESPLNRFAFFVPRGDFLSGSAFASPSASSGQPGFFSEIAFVRDRVALQNKWRKETINLIASENATSPLLDSVYFSDFVHRYAEGEPFDRYYNGTKFIDELESNASELGKKLFKCKNISLQCVSGTVANLAALKMFTRFGDSILSNSTQGGGHISHNRFGAAGVLGLNPLPFPATPDGYHLDIDASQKLMTRLSKDRRSYFSSILLGCSLYLFPQPVKELSDHAKTMNVKTIYDAAHVLGLIAGKTFQDPLKEGADLVTSSTHKTFFGPQGGLIFSDFSEEEWKHCRSFVFPDLTSNHHLFRIPALSIAFLEFLEFGESYARQVQKNAKAFASSLAEEGFKVEAEEFGFTESHQVAVNVSSFGGGQLVSDLLEASNIICNKNLLPLDVFGQKALKNPSGIRLGVQEMTRYGMREGDFAELAILFKKIVAEKREIKKEAAEFRRQFQEVGYTFAVSP